MFHPRHHFGISWFIPDPQGLMPAYTCYALGRASTRAQGATGRHLITPATPCRARSSAFELAVRRKPGTYLFSPILAPICRPSTISLSFLRTCQNRSSCHATCSVNAMFQSHVHARCLTFTKSGKSHTCKQMQSISIHHRQTQSRTLGLLSLVGVSSITGRLPSQTIL